MTIRLGVRIAREGYSVEMQGEPLGWSGIEEACGLVDRTFDQEMT